jgi:hypothetical protein
MRVLGFLLCLGALPAAASGEVGAVVMLVGTLFLLMHAQGRPR